MRTHFPVVAAAFLIAAQLPAPVAAQAAQAAPAAAPAATGAPDLNITPRRLILDRNRRVGAVYVFNQGRAPITVDVSMIDNVMLPSGEILPLAEATKRGGDAAKRAAAVVSARSMLLVTPSRLTLPPGRGKTIRLQATLPADGVAKEWRTHLTVSTVPDASAGLTAEQVANVGPNELAFRIQSIFGISIPLIVRSGAPKAVATFGKIHLAPKSSARDAQPVLLVPVNRSGDASLYGNIEVRANGKKAEAIGLVRGLGVYPELDNREVQVTLSRPLKSGETVQVTYVNDDGTSSAVLASGSFTAP